MSAEALLAAAGRALGREVERASRVGGGDINEAWRLELADGGSAFLKSRADAPPDEYEAEAAGLRWLGEAGGLRVPEVLAVVDEGVERGLALEWVAPGRLSNEGEEELGRGLALTHAAGAEGFNALPPGSPRRALRFGGVEVPVDDGAWQKSPSLRDKSATGRRSAGNPEAGRPKSPAGRDRFLTEPSDPAWPDVYAARLFSLSLVARDRAAITADCATAVECLAGRLPALAGPTERPARIHGDLWSGNVLAGADGRPWLIDPAAHGAHREMDLAMLELFGSVARRTLAAYEDVRPLADGREERVGLWQLQPLLVHAILFGGSYGAAVERTAAAYG